MAVPRRRHGQHIPDGSTRSLFRIGTSPRRSRQGWSVSDANRRARPEGPGGGPSCVHNPKRPPFQGKRTQTRLGAAASHCNARQTAELFGSPFRFKSATKIEPFQYLRVLRSHNSASGGVVQWRKAEDYRRCAPSVFDLPSVPEPSGSRRPNSWN